MPDGSKWASCINVFKSYNHLLAEVVVELEYINKGETEE